VPPRPDRSQLRVCFRRVEVSIRWRLAALALFGTLLAWHSYDVATPGLIDRSGRLKAPDFLQFYTYGALVAGNQAAELYDADAHAAIARRVVDPRLTLSAFVPNYSPVIAWLATPLASLPFPTAMAVFAVVSAVLYGAAIATLASVTARIKADVETAVLVAAAFPAMFITLRYGQISPLSLLILAAATVAAARGRPWLAGAILGLLVYKPNLLLAPGLLFLATGQWRLLMGLMVGAGGELALSLALVGPDVMRQYLALLVTLAKHPELVQFYPAESHSLRGLVQLLLPWSPLVTATTAIAIPLGTWLAVRVWRAHADFRPRWAALAMASLVASPHVLTYDLILLAVPLVLLLDWWLETGSGLASPMFRWGLALLYFGAWPGPFIARLYQVQVSTVGMLGLLWLLAQASRADRA
jgi:alpha-1,2-mannosyltransferase